jgi:ABC-type multidrug transport system ATPase subunit
VIRIENLVKAFGAKRAVDGVSFAVERGEVLGFLGPNGAGKSTTMRLITGFLPPSSGRVSVGGHDVAEATRARKRLAASSTCASSTRCFISRSTPCPRATATAPASRRR